jgi:4-alpha-glucanotransferase
VVSALAAGVACTAREDQQGKRCSQLRPALPAGTHDNQTAVGWWKKGAQSEEKALIRAYTG